MVAAIIILSIVLLLGIIAAIFALGLAGDLAAKVFNAFESRSPVRVDLERHNFTEWFETNVVEEYPCTVLLDTSPKDFMGTVTDFSLYEDYGIVCIQESVPGVGIGDEPVLLPNQKVCKMSDGQYLLDIR